MHWSAGLWNTFVNLSLSSFSGYKACWLDCRDANILREKQARKAAEKAAQDVQEQKKWSCNRHLDSYREVFLAWQKTATIQLTSEKTYTCDTAWNANEWMNHLRHLQTEQLLQAIALHACHSAVILSLMHVTHSVWEIFWLSDRCYIYCFIQSILQCKSGWRQKDLYTKILHSCNVQRSLFSDLTVKIVDNEYQ